jgi:hypothetical protein
MKTFCTPRIVAAVAAAALAGTALVVPVHDAEARKGGVAVRDHRAPAPVARAYRSVGTTKSPSGAKLTPRVGTARKLTCVGSFCPRERPLVPKATTTGTYKANPNPVTPGSVTIRDHRRPKCSASGHCRPRRFYYYNGQRILLQPWW